MAEKDQLKVKSWRRNVSCAGYRVCLFSKCTYVPKIRKDLRGRRIGCALLYTIKSNGNRVFTVL